MPKDWRFSFSIRPSNKYSGLISFRIDWFVLLVVQGTLRSLFQYHSWKTSTLQCSTFFMVLISHWFMTTGKTTTLTMQIFIGKVRSLLLNILSSFVRAVLPRSKHLLISWLQLPSTVIFGVQANNICHCFHVFLFYLSRSDGTRCHDLSFWMLSFKPSFSFSSFTLIKKLCSSSLLSVISVVSSAYLRLLILSPTVLIPAFYVFIFRLILLFVIFIQRWSFQTLHTFFP